MKCPWINNKRRCYIHNIKNQINLSILPVFTICRKARFLQSAEQSISETFPLWRKFRLNYRWSLQVSTCNSSLSSPITAAVFQSMISEKGSSQPLLSITGTQAAWKTKPTTPLTPTGSVNKHAAKERDHFQVTILTIPLFFSSDSPVKLWLSINTWTLWIVNNIYT